MDKRGKRFPTSEKTFFDRLKKVSYSKGVSLVELAEGSGVHYSTLIIQNKKFTLNCHNLMAICNYLDCSADYLLFGKGIPIFRGTTREEWEQFEKEKLNGHKNN
jgi:DNA-binding Xre family transcriptional regulator